MRGSKRNVYVVIRKDDLSDVVCYSNLTKLVANTPNVTYSPLYRGLKEYGCVDRSGYWIVKTKLR